MNFKVYLRIGIPLLFLIGIIAFYTLPWLVIYLGIQSQPNPPRPAIRYGEFPFRLEYEVDGQRKIVKDTLICEFDGFGSDEGRGKKYRKWTQKLASGNEEILLLKLNENKKIYFFPGSAEYYMGEVVNTMSEIDNAREPDDSFPNAMIIEREDRITSEGFIHAHLLFEQYKIKLISWDTSQPIENNFATSNK